MRELLRVAASSAVGGGVLGVLLSIYLSTIVQAMTVFYSLLGVSLFVPVLGGLYSRRARTGRGARRHRRRRGRRCSWYASGLPDATPWLDPTLSGLVAAAAVAFVGRDGSPFGRQRRIARRQTDRSTDEHYRIAVIAGDGIGKEVIPAGIEVLKLAAEQGGFRCEFTAAPVGMRLLPAARPHDGRRRRRSPDEVRRDLPRAPSAIRGWPITSRRGS